VRGLLRSRHIDMLSNSGYNLTNGETRQTVNVPEHQNYNPPGSAHSSLAKAGSQVFGDGFAGRPLRMQDKVFGKRVGNAEEGQFTPNPGYNQQGSYSQMQQQKPVLPIN